MDVSPVRLRIQQVSQRLQNVQLGIEREKSNQQQVFLNNLRKLESAVDKTDEEFKNELNGLNSQLKHINFKIQQEENTRENFQSRKTTEINQLLNNLKIQLNSLEKSRKKFESGILKSLQDSVFPLKIQINQQRKARAQQSQKQQSEIQKAVQSISELVADQTQIRITNTNHIYQKAQQAISEFQAQMEVEKENRDSSMETMTGMVQDLEQRLIGEIRSQGQERQHTQSCLLDLLETTCSQVENGFRF